MDIVFQKLGIIILMMGGGIYWVVSAIPHVTTHPIAGIALLVGLALFIRSVYLLKSYLRK